MTLEQDISVAVLEKDNPEKLQKMVDYIGHKYEAPFVATDKGLNVIKPLIAKMYAGTRCTQKELELLYMLARPSIDVDLFPNEFTTLNELEEELVERFWFTFSYDRVMALAVEYMERGLMKRNPLYEPNALKKLRELTKK